METYSRWVLEEALKRNDWNQTRAAEELGLQRTYFTKLSARSRSLVVRRSAPRSLPPETSLPLLERSRLIGVHRFLNLAAKQVTELSR